MLMTLKIKILYRCQYIDLEKSILKSKLVLYLELCVKWKSSSFYNYVFVRKALEISSRSNFEDVKSKTLITFLKFLYF